MKIHISEKSERELDKMEPELRKLFFKHMEKINEMPPRRHLKFGMPFNVEDVTRQARMLYHIQGDILYVVKCFQNHKEYERWYKSFK
ncbi:MAG: hypothetical protein ABIG39_04145 [Candidatus Micrarchaeota archaeon]